MLLPITSAARGPAVRYKGCFEIFCNAILTLRDCCHCLEVPPRRRPSIFTRVCVVVHGDDLRRLDASSNHGCRHQSDSGASLSLGLDCGTVCHQPCLIDYTVSLNTFKQKLKTHGICSDSDEHSPMPLCGVPVISGAVIQDRLIYFAYLLSWEVSRPCTIIIFAL